MKVVNKVKVCILALAVMLTAACNDDKTKDDPAATIQAGFTFNKSNGVYRMTNDPVIITNTSTVENAQIASYKWEYLGKESSEQVPPPATIVFTEAGTYKFKLTVTADRGGVSDWIEKEIEVINDDRELVAHFDWAPKNVIEGRPVRFTDQIGRASCRERV